MAFAGDEIFFADQHLNTEPTDGVSKNEVMVKFKHFLKVDFEILLRNGQRMMSLYTKIN